MLNRAVNHALPGLAYAVPAMETMGEQIRSLRQARGLTQVDLARAVGVTKSAVCQWEDGSTQNIRLAHFMALLRALGTDAPYLIWGADRAPDGDLDSFWRSKRSR